ncbi:hypothetical protein AAFF_G00044120 [Aldrovandia affinis]|uniref:Uncharacterized protein n=1 Tax=Aldrovandia affinis TaxID=143900 RepID=A0AAD7S284_9TELE|nr:hypothetical protein AAFF_G00044120 [Aldrovandia affinis]
MWYGPHWPGKPSELRNLLLCEVSRKLHYAALAGAKSPSPSPTLEGSVQNVELKFCSRAAVRCASGTVGAVKVCARTPAEGGKEKLVPLIQGPSDTKELHMRRWLNEIRKPESLLAPDLLAFSVQVPQQGRTAETPARGGTNPHRRPALFLARPPTGGGEAETTWGASLGQNLPRWSDRGPACTGAPPSDGGALIGCEHIKAGKAQGNESHSEPCQNALSPPRQRCGA